MKNPTGYDAKLDRARLTSKQGLVAEYINKRIGVWFSLDQIVDALVSQNTGRRFPATTISRCMRMMRDESQGGWLIEKKRVGRLENGYWEFRFTKPKINDAPLVSIGPSGIGGEYQKELFETSKGKQFDIEV